MMSTEFSRRSVLFGIGSAAAVAATGGVAVAQNAYARLDGVRWYFLSDAEARSLAAMCDMLIPEDDYPSASQAGVIDYIDLQLAGPYGRGSDLYLEGPFRPALSTQGYQLPYTPANLFRTALSRLIGGPGDPVALDDDGRASLLAAMSEGEIALGDIAGSTFFSALWNITNEGYFADPMYGGNENYAGWKMVGFPGAHAYYSEFVDLNRPFPAPPKGISHTSGTDRPMSTATRSREG